MKLEGLVDHSVMSAQAYIHEPQKVIVRMHVRMRLENWKKLSEILSNQTREPAYTLRKLIDCTVANAEAQVAEIMEVGEVEE